MRTYKCVPIWWNALASMRNFPCIPWYSILCTLINFSIPLINKSESNKKIESSSSWLIWIGVVVLSSLEWHECSYPHLEAYASCIMHARYSFFFRFLVFTLARSLSLPVCVLSIPKIMRHTVMDSKPMASSREFKWTDNLFGYEKENYAGARLCLRATLSKAPLHYHI